MQTNEIDLYRRVGQLLRVERIKQNITLEQVAAKLGVTAKTIQRYELGERMIRLSTLMQIIEMLDLDSNEIMTRAKVQIVKQSPEPKNDYILENELSIIAQEIYDKLELRALFDISRNLNKEELQLIVDIVERIKQ